MTNIVFVVPCVLIYIWINRKALTRKVFGVSALMAGIPCSVYLVFNYICTKNPVFPYFNKIFKSPLCVQINIKDLRWGGTNFSEKILWLFSIVFKPEYRVSELPNWNTFVYALGIIGMLCVLLGKIYHIIKRDFGIEKIDILVIILLCSSVLWSFTTGYNRYFMFGYILLGGLAYYLISIFLRKSTYRMICWVIFLGGLTTVGANIVYFMEGSGWSGNEWKPDTFVQQMKEVFRDKEFQEEYMDVDMFYLTNNVYGGIAELINSKACIVTTNYCDYYPDKEILTKILAENKALYEGEVYDIRELNINRLKGYVSVANEHDIHIKDIKIYASDAGEYALIKLNKDESENYCVELKNGILLNAEMDIEQAVCEFICGNNNLKDESQGQELKLTVFHEGVLQKTLEVAMGDADISRYEIDMGKICKGDVIRIESCDAVEDGKTESYFVMNARIVEKKN